MSHAINFLTDRSYKSCDFFIQKCYFVSQKYFKMKFLITAFVLYCSTIGLSHAQTATFDIEVLQDGKHIPVNESHELRLKRAPFVLKVHLKGISEVYCQAGFSDSMFLKSPEAAIENFKDIPAMSMAEEQFNANQALIIQAESWHCWFYDPKLDWHRFDQGSVTVKGNEVVATKTIGKLLIIDEADLKEAQRFERKLNEPNPPIYLFFLSAEEDKQQWYLEQELDRYALKLSWSD